MPRRHRTAQIADALRDCVLACSVPSTRPGASAIVSLTPAELHALAGTPREAERVRPLALPSTGGSA